MYPDIKTKNLNTKTISIPKGNPSRRIPQTKEEREKAIVTDQIKNIKTVIYWCKRRPLKIRCKIAWNIIRGAL